jgi:hypothetical protein
MISLSTALSLLLFVAFILYPLAGIYIYSLHKGAKQNTACLVLCLLLSFCSISYSISETVYDAASALLWRRAAALGWGIIYCVSLHFILLVTDEAMLRRKKWIHYLPYLPALVNILLSFIVGACPTSKII